MSDTQGIGIQQLTSPLQWIGDHHGWHFNLFTSRIIVSHPMMAGHWSNDPGWMFRGTTPVGWNRFPNLVFWGLPMHVARDANALVPTQPQPASSSSGHQQISKKVTWPPAATGEDYSMQPVAPTQTFSRTEATDDGTVASPASAHQAARQASAIRTGIGVPIDQSQATSSSRLRNAPDTATRPLLAHPLINGKPLNPVAASPTKSAEARRVTQSTQTQPIQATKTRKMAHHPPAPGAAQAPKTVHQGQPALTLPRLAASKKMIQKPFQTRVLASLEPEAASQLDAVTAEQHRPPIQHAMPVETKGFAQRHHPTAAASDVVTAEQRRLPIQHPMPIEPKGFIERHHPAATVSAEVPASNPARNAKPKKTSSASTVKASASPVIQRQAETRLEANEPVNAQQIYADTTMMHPRSAPSQQAKPVDQNDFTLTEQHAITSAPSAHTDTLLDKAVARELVFPVANDRLTRLSAFSEKPSKIDHDSLTKPQKSKQDPLTETQRHGQENVTISGMRRQTIPLVHQKLNGSPMNEGKFEQTISPSADPASNAVVKQASASMHHASPQRPASTQIRHAQQGKPLSHPRQRQSVLNDPAFASQMWHYVAEQGFALPVGQASEKNGNVPPKQNSGDSMTVDGHGSMVHLEPPSSPNGVKQPYIVNEVVQSLMQQTPPAALPDADALQSLVVSTLSMLGYGTPDSPMKPPNLQQMAASVMHSLRDQSRIERERRGMRA